MSSDEAPTARDDFFTLIHKGLRQMLFDATKRAGTLDWDDRAAVDGFALQWSELHHLLQIHAKHEDEHFFSLLDERAPETVSGVHAEHHDLESELDQLDALVRAQVATPSAAGGLEVYRALSAFVARYLLHLLEEETVVMPAIWERCTDDELAQTRAAFMASMAPEDGALSRRVMLPAMSPGERLLLVTTVRRTAPAPAVEAVLNEARSLLEPDQWRRLEEQLESVEPEHQPDTA